MLKYKNIELEDHEDHIVYRFMRCDKQGLTNGFKTLTLSYGGVPLFEFQGLSEFKKLKQGFQAFIQGVPGSGKSHVASALVRLFLVNSELRPHTVKVVDWSDYIRERLYKSVGELNEPVFLVIDNIDKERPFPNEPSYQKWTQLMSVVEARKGPGKVTIVTSRIKDVSTLYKYVRICAITDKVPQEFQEGSWDIANTVIDTFSQFGVQVQAIGGNFTQRTQGLPISPNQMIAAATHNPLSIPEDWHYD